MKLSDKDIRTAQRNHSLLTPFTDSNVQPASVDLTLGSGLVLYETIGVSNGALFNYPPKTRTIYAELSEQDTYYIQPNEFLLAHTVETIKVPANLLALVSGKSSLARLGLLIHTTAGFIDPGFTGQITLELKNLGPVPIALDWGMRICQVSFDVLSSTAEFPYGSKNLGSHYQGQTGATESAL